MKTDHHQILKDHNLSLTSVRLALLDALAQHPHSDANHLFDEVEKRLSTASRQAIYNNLNTLVDHGIIREIKPKGQASLYETRVGDNHHHLVCRSCKTVHDTACKGSAPCLTPTDSHGFDIDEAEIIFWGLCPDCQTK
ncbi:MAG: Fur family transcriptional regulator [Planktomarina sp.]